jgi:hypothetical protein
MTNLFRISLTNATGHHIEDKPFPSIEAAQAYADEEGKKYGATHCMAALMGEAVLMKVEVTDTFGGEANYCWVHRHEKWILKDTPDRECVRIAKELEGWTGHPCMTENFGGKSGFTIRPRGMAQIMFINFDYDTEIA